MPETNNNPVHCHIHQVEADRQFWRARQICGARPICRARIFTKTYIWTEMWHNFLVMFKHVAASSKPKKNIDLHCWISISHKPNCYSPMNRHFRYEVYPHTKKTVYITKSRQIWGAREWRSFQSIWWLLISECKYNCLQSLNLTIIEFNSNSIASTTKSPKLAIDFYTFVDLILMLWHINPQRNRWIIVDPTRIELATSRLRQHHQLPVVQHVRFMPQKLCQKHNTNEMADAALNNWQPVWNARVWISAPVCVIFDPACTSQEAIYMYIRVFNSLSPTVTSVLQQISHHWFRKWVVACSAPTHYLSKCWCIVEITTENTF